MIHFRSYLATIIAIVVKEIPTPRRPASTSPSPSQTTYLSIRVRVRIIKMSDESQSSFLHEIKKTLRLICHRFFFQSTPVDGYRGLVDVIASEQLQLHLVLAVVEAVELQVFW